MTPAEKRKRTIAANKAAAKVNGARLRRRRLEAGITQEQASTAVEQALNRWQQWELGTEAYRIWQLPAIAAALGIPIASLLVDECVLAEVRISEETLARVKREGVSAADEVAAAIAANLRALLLAEASREPVDLRPYARARPRRSREQVLAGSTRGGRAAGSTRG